MIKDDELMTLSIAELRLLKQYLIGIIKCKTSTVKEIRECQRKTRQIDKRIKSLFINKC